MGIRPAFDAEVEPTVGWGKRRGVVVLYVSDPHTFTHRHEYATRTESAKRLAALKGFDFAGEYEPGWSYSGPVYFVPNDTLTGLELAKGLGIRTENDLFGGVVPHPFVATKAVTHPLGGPDAEAPPGWSYHVGPRLEHATLRGFSAFTLADARHAGERLLRYGPVRLKPSWTAGGHGQVVASNAAELESALVAVATEPEALSSHGLVLEENLTGVTTYSVGQVQIAEFVATYYGTQRLTSDNQEAVVYGGSDLFVVRGDWDKLLEREMPEAVRLAVAQARTYDRTIRECYPELIVSRCNYDVAQGLDVQGRRRSGVLEQSWRIGGASTAEITALEAFRALPALEAVRASSFEVYGRSEPPPQATVYFRGVDGRDGPLTKYALVEVWSNAG